MAFREWLLYVPVLALEATFGGSVSVQHVVLAELIARRGCGYGYELRDQSLEFLRALGYSDTVVYAALDGLERNGMVRVVDRPGSTRKARKGNPRVYYEATEDGHREHASWMASMPGKSPLREVLHMQLMEAGPEDLAHMAAAVGQYEEECHEQLRALMERPLRASPARAGAPGPTFVQDGLMTHLQAAIEWAQRTRRSLENLIPPSDGLAGRQRP